MIAAMPDYATMDEALDRLAPFGPDLRNGLTNHAPMAAEALCALGRPEAVLPWVERYRAGMLPQPAPRARIDPHDWRGALGREDRFADWTAFFADALAEAPWRTVAATWTARLAPGLCTAATHGVLRAAHAVRSLAERETPARCHELAQGLAQWAAAYQTLPTAAGTTAPAGRPGAAIARVPIVPEAERRFDGTITSSLAGLAGFPRFAAVIDLADVAGPAEAVVSDLTETFARVYLANARDVLGAIVFIHGVTSTAALRSLLPLLDAAAARDALRYAWQTGCALYAAFASRPPVAGDVAPPADDAATLVDLAIAHGDEHAIKLTEACLREHAARASPVYLAAARHALGVLPRPG
jgi:hypothetical protein